MTTIDQYYNEAPTVHFLAGLPASGKSTYRTASGLNDMPVVDCDKFKQRWLGEGISDTSKVVAVHEASSVYAARHYAKIGRAHV